MALNYSKVKNGLSRVGIQAILTPLLETTSSLQITLPCSNWQCGEDANFLRQTSVPKCWIQLRLLLEVQKQSDHLLRNFTRALVVFSWLDVDPFSQVKRHRDSRKRWHRHWCLFRSCFRSKSPCTVSNFIVALFLGFFRPFRYVFVQSNYDHIPWMRFIGPVRIWLWSRSRNGLGGNWLLPPILDRSSCFHGSILLLWIIGEVMCTLDTSHPILPVPHRQGSQILPFCDSLHVTCIGAQSNPFNVITKICDFSFIFSQQVSLHRFIGQKWFGRCRQLCGY